MPADTPFIPRPVVSKPILRQLPPKPDTDPALPGLAEIATIISFWENADQRFAGELDKGELPVKALAALGVRLCLASKNSEAISVLAAAVALAGDDIPILNNYAVALERMGRTDQAIQAVQRSLSLLPDQPDSWVFLGTLKRKQQDLSDAQRAYEKALQYQPRSSLIWQELGLLRKQQREFLPAIDCLLKSIRFGFVTAPILSILGQLFFSTGQFEKARDAYQAAADLDPQNTIYIKMLRQMQFVCSAARVGQLDEAIDHHGAAGEELQELLHTTYALLSGYGHHTAAQQVADKRLKLFPQSSAAAYLAQAIRGDSKLARTPDEFLVETFNRAADRFDQHLVETLGYDIPAKLVSALKPFIPANSELQVLDAGCGTGLCAALLRPMAIQLIGVDLSPGMLEQARRRNLYDQLHCQELTSFLNAEPDKYDVIVAADVVIYFGDLTALVMAFANALRPGALLGFSTERSDTLTHQLKSSGRFAHHPKYVRTLFNQYFEECFSAETTVRHEANKAVSGEIFVFRKR